MSSAFFSNFIAPDVLQETRLKPWFETVRGYLVITNIVVSIFMVYDAKSENILNCISANASAEFSAPTTAYVNSYCAAHFLGWHQRNAGLVCLLCSVFIYLSFGWWLLIPSVKKSFLLIRQYDDQLQELQRGPTYLKSIIRKFYSDTLPNKIESDNAEASKLIIATQQVWYNHLGSISIFTIYLIRNAVSFGISAGTVVILAYSAAKDIENPMSCELDILNGARALCLVLAGDKLFPFIMTVICVTSLLGICALVLFVWFGFKRYGECVNKLNCQLTTMCWPKSDTNNTGQTDEEEALLNGTSDDAWQKELEKRTSDRKKAWDLAGLDPLDLERIEHGEDCNRFVKLFSQHAEPISANTRILMYFYLVIEREDIRVCPERFALLSPETKMKKEKTFMAKVKTAVESGNAGIFNKFKELHNGKEFGKFVKTHEETFSNEDRASNQLLDDRNDACGCKSLFNGDIRLDGNGCSLMWHAFNNLKSTPESDGVKFTSKLYLAAHLALASIDEVGKPRPASVVESNGTKESLSNHLRFEKAPEPEDENYNRYIVKKMVDMGLKRRRHDITH